MNAFQQIPFVGREQELAVLHARLNSALSEPDAGPGERLCVVRGATGSGKSTVVRQFAARAPEQHDGLMVVWGQCDRHAAAGTPLLPWRQILDGMSGASVAPGTLAARFRAGQQSARRALKELGPDLFELLVPGSGLVIRSARLLTDRSSLAQRVAARLRQPGGGAAGVDADRSKLGDHYARALDAVARTQPLLLIIEDLQWADAASRSMLRHLIRRLQNAPILFVVTSQAAEAPDDLPEHAATIDLNAAQGVAGQAFTSAVVEAVAPAMDEEFKTSLWRHTNGNPLFIGEVLSSLAGRGLLAADGGEVRIRSAINWDDLPFHVEAAIEQQMSRMSDEVRQIAEAGSVEGETFAIEVVATLLSQSPLELIRRLNRADQTLLEPVGTSLLGQSRVTRYRFSHGLHRDYFYNQIPDVERPFLHEAVAQRLVELAGTAHLQIAGTLAWHFERAVDPARSAEYYVEAALQSRSMCAMEQAASHYERALALGEHLDDTERVEIVRAAARLAGERGNGAFASELLESVQSVVPRLAPTLQAAVFADTAQALLTTRAFDAARASAARAVEVAEQLGDPESHAVALAAQSRCLELTGDTHSALALRRDVLALRETFLAAPDEILASDLRAVGWLLKETGQNEEAERALTASIAMFTQLRDPSWAALANAYGALADLYINMERYDAARDTQERAIAIWSKYDQHGDITIAVNNLANIANRQQRYAEGLIHADRAYTMDVELSGADDPVVAFPLTCKGESLIGLARFDDAIDTLQMALDLRLRHGVAAGNIAWTRWLLGKALVESGTELERGHDAVVQARGELMALGEAAASETREIDAWLAQRSSSA